MSFAVGRGGGLWLWRRSRSRSQQAFGRPAHARAIGRGGVGYCGLAEHSYVGASARRGEECVVSRGYREIWDRRG